VSDEPEVTAKGSAIPAEGASPIQMVPKGLRRVPHGLDELATEHLILNMGPQHPSTHGVLHVLLELDGEEVQTAEASVGYLHRGIEKLAESRKYHQVGTLLDRADYTAGMHTETAFALATERLAEIEVPEKASWIRCLVMELNRIASHTIWIGTFGMDAGAMAPFLYMMRDREALLDILETISGGRMMFNYVRPGGVFADLPVGVDEKIRKWLSTFGTYLDEWDALLGGNEIFQVRMKDVGVFSRETALAFGLTGATLRGSGVDFDVRKAMPYCAYPQLDFEVPLGSRGDCWDRYVVRVEEMRQAARLIRQLVDGIPEGEFTAKVPKVLKPPAGECYAAVESPRGELGVHLVSDGGPTPYRMRLRSPAYYNLSIVDEALAGGLIADAVVIMASLDVVLGEIDR
jgi:NADH-quinone oxidoreductase subunit D